MFCLVCMTNPSNVVAIPCNHLSMCHDCFSVLKQRYQSGESANFDCPVCRAELDTEHHILINYNPGKH